MFFAFGYDVHLRETAGGSSYSATSFCHANLYRNSVTVQDRSKQFYAFLHPICEAAEQIRNSIGKTL